MSTLTDNLEVPFDLVVADTNYHVSFLGWKKPNHQSKLLNFKDRPKKGCDFTSTSEKGIPPSNFKIRYQLFKIKKSQHLYAYISV